MSYLIHIQYTAFYKAWYIVSAHKYQFSSPISYQVHSQSIFAGLPPRKSPELCSGHIQHSAFPKPQQILSFLCFCYHPSLEWLLSSLSAWFQNPNQMPLPSYKVFPISSALHVYFIWGGSCCLPWLMATYLFTCRIYSPDCELLKCTDCFLNIFLSLDLNTQKHLEQTVTLTLEQNW